MSKLHQVLTDRPQAFSEAEKAQARSNIGAAAVGEGGGGEPSPLKVFQYGVTTKEEMLEYLEAGRSTRSCVVCLNGTLYTNTGYSYTGSYHLSFQASYWTADLPEGSRPDASVVQRVKDAHMYLMTIKWDEDGETENGWSHGPSYTDMMGGFAEGEFFIATYNEDKFSTIRDRMTVTRKSTAAIYNQHLYTFSRRGTQGDDTFYEYSRIVSFASDKVVLEYVRVNSQDVWSTETVEVPTGPTKLFEGSETFQWMQEPAGTHYSWMLPVTDEMVPDTPANLDIVLAFRPSTTAFGRPQPPLVQVTVPFSSDKTVSFCVNSLWQNSTVGSSELREQCAMFVGNLSIVQSLGQPRYLCIHLARMYPLTANPGATGYPSISGDASGDQYMTAPVLNAIYLKGA